MPDSELVPPTPLRAAPLPLELAYARPHRNLFRGESATPGRAPPLYSSAISEHEEIEPYVLSHAERELSLSLPHPAFARGWTRIQTDRLRHYTRNHPNRPLVDFLLQGFTEGFSFGYKGDAKPFELPNLRSVNLAPDKIDDNVATEVGLGRMSQPMDDVPHSLCKVSPIGQVPKRNSTKIRQIFHLSAAPPGGMSVNDGIDPESCRTFNEGIPVAIAWLRHLGRNTWMFKIDIEWAFRLMPLRPLDLLLHVFKWRDKYYVDKNVSFGARSSPYLWNTFANILCWVAFQENPTLECLMHYMDDFLGMVQATYEEALELYKALLGLLEDIGAKPNLPKCTSPCQKLIYVGFELCSTTMMVTIPADRLASLRDLLDNWLRRHNCRVRELDSLASTLIWYSQIIPHARTFSQAVLTARSRNGSPHAFRNINSEMRRDLLWWRDALDTWPGLSLIADDDWQDALIGHLSTDSTPTMGGAIFGNAFTQVNWPASANPNIQPRELATVLVALETFRSRVFGRKLIVYHDNEANTKAFDRTASANDSVHAIIHALYLCQLRLRCEIRLIFLPGSHNEAADFISRHSLAECQQRWPTHKYIAPVVPKVISAALALPSADRRAMK